MKLFGWIICLIPFMAIGQEAEFSGTINWSELFPVNKKIKSPDIIGQDGESIYLSRFIKKQRYIEKYNLSTLTLEKSAEVDLVYEKKYLRLSNQFMFGGVPTLMTTYRDEKTNIVNVYMHTIDPSTLAVSSPKKVHRYIMPDNKTSLLLAKRPSALELLAQLSGSVPVTISEDGELAYTAGPDPTLTKEEMEAGDFRIKGILLDANGEVLAESLLDMPLDNFAVMQIKLTNEGVVYMLGYEIVEDEEAPERLLSNRQRVKKGTPHMLIFDVESGEIEDYTIDIQGREVEMMQFIFTADGGVNIGGLSRVDGYGVNGSFFIKFDKNFQQVSSEMNDFEADFITSTWSNKSKEKMEKKKDKGKDVEQPEFYDYYVRGLVSKPDGSCLMLAEQYYVHVVTTSYTDANGNRHTTTTYYYYYNDILAINYAANGELMWKKVIPKKQSSVNDGGYYSSFFSLLDGNNVHIIYNDSESNYVDLESMTSAERKAVKNSTIGAKVTLTADGEVLREKLFEFEEGGLRLVPKICEPAGDDLIFLYARSAKGDKVGTINFNE